MRAKAAEADAEYGALLESVELQFDEAFLAMGETEVAKLLQKKKEASLKGRIAEGLATKARLKQRLRDTETAIKVG